MTTSEKIAAILEYAAEHPSFDDAWVWSVKEQYEARGELTLSQARGLDNIIDRYRIEA